MGGGMTVINTNGMSFVGPGSEWFWTAVSGMVLAATFVAIYRQLRLQVSSMVRDQVDRLEQEWMGERMERVRLALYHGLQQGEPIDLATPLVWDTCNFWEKVGALAQSRHVNLDIIRNTLGSHAVMWWAIMARTCSKREATDRCRHSMSTLSGSRSR